MAALEELMQRHPVWRGAALSQACAAVPTGYPELDRELPGGGWPSGALTEVLGAQAGIGELQLVLPVLARLTRAGKRVVWLSPPHVPYAPALAAAGVDLTHLVVVSAPGRRDALWAAEQVLRAGSCHALLAWLRNGRYRELQRLAVAAEGSRAFVALFRPREAAGESSPACLRLALQPSSASSSFTGALEVQILKRRGAAAGAPLHLNVTRPFHALGRTAFPLSARGRAPGDRRLDLPVHA